ncbi:MAG: DNA polymerase III subunit delta [Gemmatimonadales bacterium]
MAVTFNSMYKKIHAGKVAPVTYLTGSEDLLKGDLVEGIVDALLDPESRDFNLDVAAAQDLDSERFVALVDTPPMLAERRVVVVRGVEQWRKNGRQWKALLDYCARPSTTTALILLQAGTKDPDKRLAQQVDHGDIGPLEPHRLSAWLQDRCERWGTSIEPAAAAHLIKVVGTELGLLDAELQKITVAIPTGATIAEEDVVQLVGVRRGETLHDWITAIIEGNLAAADAMVDVVLAQREVTGVRMVMSLGTALIGVRVARGYLDGGSSASKTEAKVLQALRDARPMRTGPWGQESKRWTRAAARWNAGGLDHAIRAAYDADRALKSTTITDERGVIRNMLLEICVSLEVAA